MSFYFFDIEPGTGERFVAYNNLATQDGREGRLTVAIQLGESYVTEWEFEWYEDDIPFNSHSPYHRKGLPAELPPLHGHDVVIPKPRSSSSSPEKSRLGKYIENGVASDVDFGKVDEKVSSLEFALPNLIFGNQKGPRRSQVFPEDAYPEYRVREVRGRTVDGIKTGFLRPYTLDVQLDDYWRLCLSVEREFLSEDQPVSGFYVTTTGAFLPPMKMSEDDDIRLLEFSEGVEKVDLFARFISFANSGFTYPLYVEGFRMIEGGEPDSYIRCGRLRQGSVTGFQDIGYSFLHDHALNATQYLMCFPSFEKMLRKSHWQNYWEDIVADYHKAVSPYAPFRSRVRSISSALESLAFVLLREKGDGTLSNRKYNKMNLKTRLAELLRRVGISYDGLDSEISIVKNLRNDSTHAKQKLDEALRDDGFRKAISWFEEVVLWRLGFSGRYRPWTSKNRFGDRDVRYDLSTRLDDW